MAQVNAASDPVHEGNPVSNARNRIEGSTERVAKMVSVLRGIADDLYGPGADSVGGPCPPPRMGEFGILHDQIDNLMLAVDALENQVVRLSPLAVQRPGTPATSLSGYGGTR